MNAWDFRTLTKESKLGKFVSYGNDQMKQRVPVLVENSLVGLGARVVIARKVRELTQGDLAHLADVGVSTVASLEAGYHGVSMGNFLKILKALDLLDRVDTWLAPAHDPEVAAFATRKLAVRRGP